MRRPANEEACLPPAVRRAPPTDVLVYAQPRRFGAAWDYREGTIQGQGLFLSDEQIEFVLIAIEG